MFWRGVEASRACWIAAAIACCACTARAESVRELIERGNELMDAGDARGAAEVYAQASAADAGSARAIFNEAVARHALGELDEASALYRDADVLAGADAEGRSISSSARFNLARLEYERAPSLDEMSVVADPEFGAKSREAIERLGAASSLLRGALAADPGAADAERNLELTRGRLREVRRLVELHEQMQPPSGGEPDEDAEPNDEQDDQDPNSDANEDPGDQQGQDDRQEQPGEGEQEEQDGSPGAEPEQPDGESESGDEPAGEPPPSGGGGAFEVPEGEAMDPTEELLRALLEREEAQRERLRAIRDALRGPSEAVERDW